MIVDPVVLGDETLCPQCLAPMTCRVGRNLDTCRAALWWVCTEKPEHRSAYMPLPVGMSADGAGIIPGVRRDARDGLQNSPLAGSPAHQLHR